MGEVAEDEGRRETGSSLWWWFSLNRENGGPAYHPHQHMACPFFVWYFNFTVSTLIFIFPLVACLVLLPSFRHKNWTSFFVVSIVVTCTLSARAERKNKKITMILGVSQVLLCLGTGFLLTVVYGSSSWLVGEAAVNVSVGPVTPPLPGKLGMWAGLWHVNLTYDTETLALNERVDWVTRKDLVEAHKKALREGWPLALVSLTAEFGGEGMDWRGLLGDGIMTAGMGSSALLVAAMGVWGVWVLLFTVSPQLAAPPLMFSGAIMTTCSLVYVIIVDLKVPHMLIVAGTKMELHLGYAWWICAVLGLCLTIVGIGLLLYDYYQPGKLATIFELDFGSPLHRLHHSSWSGPKAVHASKEADEPYSQYPRTRLSSCFNDFYVLSDDEETSRPPENKKSEHTIPKWKRIRNAPDCFSTPHPKSNEKRLLSEAPQTLGEDDITPSLDLTTLGEEHSHTAFSPPPDTLRRRSPEQPLEQEGPPPPPLPSPQHRITPSNPEAPDTSVSATTSLSDNHSTILVEKHQPKTNASLRTHIMRLSTRSQKFHRCFSKRLSYRSPMKKSLSLSKITQYSEIRGQFEDEDDEMGEWVEEKEEEDECGEDDESYAKKESITNL